MMLVVCPFCLHRKGVSIMARDTSLGYIVANKFSMDPDKRQKIFSQCKKEDDRLEQRKQEILEKYADENTKSTVRKNDFKKLVEF
jgi:hypothetical protein